MGTRRRRLQAVVIAAWASAAAALLAALWLTVWSDRDGGVTLLLLRRAPTWAPEVDAHVAWRELGWLLVRGNENGVLGEAPVRWNARVGAFALGVAAAFFSGLLVWCPKSEAAAHPAARALRWAFRASVLVSSVAIASVTCTCEVHSLSSAPVGLRVRAPSLAPNRCYDPDVGSGVWNWSELPATLPPLYRAWTDLLWQWPMLLALMLTLGLCLTRIPRGRHNS